VVLSGCCLVAAPAAADWPTFTNQTATRLVSDAAVGVSDTEEKDYIWGDVDQDKDIDLVVVRKQPFTSAGGRRNVLFLNVNGVLTDSTAAKIPGFLDATNDRDVQLVDVDNDTWLDIVTAAACNGCSNPNSNIVDDSRLYMNLGAPGGTWLGYGTPTVLFGDAHDFCGVAGGDITGDGYNDLYFLSYLDNLEDQVLINVGASNPGTFTLENNRLTAAMRASDFGTAVIFADMDNDGDQDIVKGQNSPVNMFRNNGTGFFDLNDFTYEAAAYHVEVGYLNGDGLLDLAIADDGIDRVILNNGNLLNGGPDVSLALPGSTNDFGSELLIADLDEDGWNDVIISDVDVDIPGCSRVSDLVRNNGNGSSYTTNQSNIPTALLTGVHDFAIFDINGDSLLDIVIGRCNGTSIMINSPPTAITFGYPNGQPGFVTPDESTTFQVEISPTGGTVAPGTPAIHVSVNGGPFSNTPMTAIGGQLYEAVIPPGDCADTYKFYFSAQLNGGPVFNDPPTAPGSTYSTIAAAGTQELYADAIEGDVSSWTISSSGLTAGEWEQAVPNVTIFNGLVAAPGSDATPSPGSMAFVTENGAPGGGAALTDVDGGPTLLTSPTFNLAGNDGLVSYNRWVFSSTGIHDVLIVEVSNDNGANWVQAESVTGTSSTWQPGSFFVSSFVTPSAQVKVRFSICDCPNDSVTEGGVDDFKIEILDCGKTNPCPWDTDGSGSVDTVDFLDLLGAWGPNPGHPADINGDGTVDTVDFLDLLGAWGPNPGNPADINGDGTVDTVDFLDLLAHWGPCPV
jgi:hypothetical protein